MPSPRPARRPRGAAAVLLACGLLAALAAAPSTATPLDPRAQAPGAPAGSPEPGR